MTKKGLSIILILVLVLTTCPAVFASETTATGAVAASVAATPSDVAGTSYEEAVNALVEDGVISGFPDGTFRPSEGITRAAACIIAVKTMGATDEAIAAAAASGFTDLSGYDWAVKYINYAVAKGVVSGYPNGTFQPGNEVTYNEMAAMLVSAMGYKASDLSGTWPTNFSDKARELGMLSGVPFKGDYPALRGFVAMMDYSVAEQIAAANTTGTPTVPEEEPDDTTADDPAGVLADYSGKAYGVINDSALVVNEEGETVQQLEFLLGKNELLLNTKEDTTFTTANLAAHLAAGDLYGLKMSNGIVRTIDTSDNGFAGIGVTTDFENLGVTTWCPVAAISGDNDVLTITTGGGNINVTILDGASLYLAEVEGGVITGYESAKLSDIEVGYDVRVYSLTGDEPGIAEVVLIKE